MWLAVSSPSNTIKIAAFCKPALEMGKTIPYLSWVRFLFRSRLLRFVSGHRFSDAASASKSAAPLGAGHPQSSGEAVPFPPPRTSFGPRVPDPALDQAAGDGRFGLDLFAYFLLQRPRTLRLIRTLWKFGAGKGLGRGRFGGKRLGKARGDLLEGRHRLLFHRTQHHRIDQQEQQRNSNVAQRAH